MASSEEVEVAYNVVQNAMKDTGGLEKDISNEDISYEEVAFSLFQNAMKGKWDEVVKAYKSPESSKAQRAKITKSKDTALHIAVQDGQTEVVLQLLDSIGDINAFEILKIRNVKGDTPLHLAAALGDLKMCHKMATGKEALVSLGNNDGETPLFLAALNGNEDAFLCLHSHCGQDCYTRATNGDTILHAAISGEYFSLAFQIILWHPDLVNSINQNGFSPLHILASTPAAFKSNSRLGQFNRIIYQCLIVEKLKGEAEDNKACPYDKNGDTKSLGNKLCCCLNNILANEGNKSGNAGDQEKQTTSSLQGTSRSPNGRAKNHGNYIYGSSVKLFNSMMKALLMMDYFLFGILGIKRTYEEKRRHTWANQIMNKLVEKTSSYMYLQNPEETQPRDKDQFGVPDLATMLKDEKQTGHDQNALGTSGEEKRGKNELPKTDKLAHEATQTTMLIAAKMGVNEMVEKIPNKFRVALQDVDSDNKNIVVFAVESTKSDKIVHVATQTPILIAAKMGVTEMVEKILDEFPMAIRDVDSHNKNVVLVAVENRQPHVYDLLLKRMIKQENVQKNLFCQVDNQGNNALHLAAKYGDHRPWLTPGAALQMQWELKWYKFVERSIVERSMRPRSSVRLNKEGQTPKNIFTDTHKDLQDKGNNWMVKTSESCSVVTALIATVAFATSATVPGGLNDNTGQPILRDRPAFNAFTISSLLALCLSVTALVFFLSILTSRYEVHDFSMDLPRKLLLGLTSLFTSIVSVLVSFCTGHVFLLDRQLRYVAYSLYAATCLPVSIFAIAQLPLYYDLIRVIFKKVPQRSYNEYQH